MRRKSGTPGFAADSATTSRSATSSASWFGGWKSLATGDRFSDSEDDFELITKTPCASLRDMEGAAVAHVCWLNGAKCFLMKCVSDVAGQGAMTDQYLDNRQRCLLKLSMAMKKLVADV